jgi:hypothetical protein
LKKPNKVNIGASSTGNWRYGGEQIIGPDFGYQNLILRRTELCVCTGKAAEQFQGRLVMDVLSMYTAVKIGFQLDFDAKAWPK